MLEGRQESLEPIVITFEWILQQNRSLRLVVELEMYPVDGEVAPLFLCAFYKRSAHSGPSGLGRCRASELNLLIGDHGDELTLRHEAVIQASLGVGVMIEKINHPNSRIGQRNRVTGAQLLNELVFGDPIKAVR